MEDAPWSTDEFHVLAAPNPCYNGDKITSNGIWTLVLENYWEFSDARDIFNQNGTTVSSHFAYYSDYMLPGFLWQAVLVLSMSRLIHLLLKPLHQPRVVVEILTGILCSKTVLGKLLAHVFQSRRTYDYVIANPASVVAETVAYVGMTYFVFLIGVHFDATIVTRMGKRAILIAGANLAWPFVVAAALAQCFHLVTGSESWSFNLLFALVLSVTAMPVVSRLLAELKLLNTELGRASLPSAIVSDLGSWCVLALLLVFNINKPGADAEMLKNRPEMLVVFSVIAFIICCWIVVRPLICWVLRQTPEGEPVNEMHISIVAVGVLAAAMLTDAIGVHAFFGAFAFGLAVPKGPLADELVDHLEEMVISVLLPIFHVNIGLKAQFVDMPSNVSRLITTIALATMAKVGGGMLTGHLYAMKPTHALSFGLLMSMKGYMDLIVLYIGFSSQVFTNGVYSILVLWTVLVTAVASPAVSILGKTTRTRVVYKRRNLQSTRPDAELRMVACIYMPRNVPSIISLLQLSNPTKRSPIFVYALHLIELTGRATAMLIIHENTTAGKSSVGGTGNISNGATGQSEQIITALENYEQHAGGVSVQPLTAISPYSSMHDDISSIAEERHATLIILPFHELPTAAGDMEAPIPSIRDVNQRVLRNAPCSVGILVDRGLSSATRYVSHGGEHHIAVLFFGGPDDREALAYAWRMAEQPGINLTMIRFIPGEEVTASTPMSALPMSMDDGASMASGSTVVLEEEMQRQLDDQYVSDFRLKHVSDESVMYAEKVVNSSEETVSAIRAMIGLHDMYVVGRGHGLESRMLAGMTDWSEYPELGAVGDMLASTDLGVTASVLVIQQYNNGLGGTAGDAMAAAGPESPRLSVQRYLSNAKHRSRPGGFSLGCN